MRLLDPSDKKIIVRNLYLMITQDELISLIKKLILTKIVSCEIIYREYVDCKSMGIVEFLAPDVALRTASKLNGYLYNGQKLSASIHDDEVRDVEVDRIREGLIERNKK